MNCTHCASTDTRPNGSSRGRPYRKCNTCGKGFAVGIAKARGRPCINDKPMSAAERKRRSRANGTTVVSELKHYHHKEEVEEVVSYCVTLLIQDTPTTIYLYADAGEDEDAIAQAAKDLLIANIQDATTIAVNAAG